MGWCVENLQSETCGLDGLASSQVVSFGPFKLFSAFVLLYRESVSYIALKIEQDNIKVNLSTVVINILCKREYLKSLQHKPQSVCKALKAKLDIRL